MPHWFCTAVAPAAQEVFVVQKFWQLGLDQHFAQMREWRPRWVQNVSPASMPL